MIIADNAGIVKGYWGVVFLQQLKCYLRGIIAFVLTQI